MVGTMFVSLLFCATVAFFESSEGALSSFQKNFLLRKHNEMRAMVRPTAANMRKLIWDRQLEVVADRHASRCHWEHNDASTHVYQLLGGDNTRVGENIYANTNTKLDEVLVKAMKSFFNERQYYSYSTGHCSKAPCGHYTQVVWATTKSVGCAVRSCSRLGGVPWSQPAYFLVCNYGPTGNWNGQFPYQRGRQCTKCPSDAPYCDHGLCSARPDSSTPSNHINIDISVARRHQHTQLQNVPRSSSNNDRYAQLDSQMTKLVSDSSRDRQRIDRLEAIVRDTTSRLESQSRPSAHLDGGHGTLMKVKLGDVAKFWSVYGRRSHLRGGFRYDDGRLIVPRSGYYFVYSQIWNHGDKAVPHFLYANNRRLAAAGTAGNGPTTWAGGVYHLAAGEMLSLKLGRGHLQGERVVWPGGAHTYFGVFMV